MVEYRGVLIELFEYAELYQTSTFKITNPGRMIYVAKTLYGNAYGSTSATALNGAYSIIDVSLRNLS